MATEASSASQPSGKKLLIFMQCFEVLFYKAIQKHPAFEPGRYKVKLLPMKVSLGRFYRAQLEENE